MCWLYVGVHFCIQLSYSCGYVHQACVELWDMGRLEVGGVTGWEGASLQPSESLEESTGWWSGWKAMGQKLETKYDIHQLTEMTHEDIKGYTPAYFHGIFMFLYASIPNSQEPVNQRQTHALSSPTRDDTLQVCWCLPGPICQWTAAPESSFCVPHTPCQTAHLTHSWPEHNVAITRDTVITHDKTAQWYNKLQTVTQKIK